jgi:hypothetical protein
MTLDVEIAGPLFLMVDISEQLAWLGSICRKGPDPQSPNIVKSRTSLARDDGMLEDDSTLSIKFEIEEDVQDVFSMANNCWLSLFRNCCIASNAYVHPRRGEEGLELPFSLMAILGGFDRVAHYAGQLVMKGFETLFVPMRKSNESVIWHLITKPNRRRISYNAMYELSQKADPTVCMQDLYDSRHFLGWVSSASQHAGDHVHCRMYFLRC